MQVLKFSVKDRYVITVITSGDTHDLWNRFKGRVINDIDHQRTASTYCEYESSSEGRLYLLRYDQSNPNNECLSVSETESKDWKGLPPIMFETGGVYHFHIKLRNIKGKARIIHPLKDVTDCFEYVDTDNHTGLLTGVVNFLNQPGVFVLRFEYTDKDGRHHDESLTMEVVSPKLDTKHDLLEIKRLIEQEYENYVYQYLTLTYQNQSIQRKDRSEDDVWMSIFQQIVEKYIKAIRYIIEHSNKRSVQKVYYQKPDRIKRWGVHELEKMYNRGKDADKYYYRNQVSEQTINTRENRFVKHTLLKIEERLTYVFADIKKKYKDSISAEYEQMINSYCDTFRTLRHSQFFRAIGTFEGQMQESQVLQQRAGYRNVYVYWQILKSVVELENGSTQIGVRQIWKLYEVWCYLVMKRLIAKILGIEDVMSSARIEIFGSTLAECLEDDKKTCRCRFYFDKGNENGVIDKSSWTELIYQCRYEYSDSATEEHSLTIEQIPDIVLNIHHNGQETLTYLYDAKYRVYDDKIKNAEKATDEPVHDAINAMHRYRDAIYYGTTPDNRVPNHTVNRPDSKEVIGGYILFPGRVGCDERLEDKYYIKSIESINIGAFPVMPSKFDPSKPNSENSFIMCSKLEEHLYKVLTEDKVIGHIENSVPQKGLVYSDDPMAALKKKWSREKVLVFVTTNPSHWQIIDTIKSVAIGVEMDLHAFEVVKKFTKAKYVIVTNQGKDDKWQKRLFKVKGEPQLVYEIEKETCISFTYTNPKPDIYNIDSTGKPIKPKVVQSMYIQYVFDGIVNLKDISRDCIEATKTEGVDRHYPRVVKMIDILRN